MQPRLRTVSLEIELRFDVGPEDLLRLAKSPAFGGLVVGHPATRRLSTIYYDTPGLGFAKAGLALRVRKLGRSYIQTVKSEPRGPLGAERGEYENKLPSAEPDLALVSDADVRERLRTIANGDGVEPVMETEIRRTTRALTTAAGDEIELALDRGEIRTLVNGRKIVPVSELELELKSGSTAALYDVARALAHEAPLVVNMDSKSERGLRALEGHETLGPRKAGKVELSGNATSEEAFRASLTHCLRHIARNTVAVTEREEPEAVHQLRVGLRRLRVALSVLGDSFLVGPFEALRSRAHSFAYALAPARELDVFAQDLFAQAESAAKRPDLSPLRQALDELRQSAWRDVVALVHSEAFTSFLLDLASAIEASAWRAGASPQQSDDYTRPARAAAAQALDNALKKAKKRARHLAKLDFAERHRLRIALKKLRYTAEFFAPQFDAKPVSAFLGSLSRLQDLFGALNDAATAEHILERAAAHRNGTDKHGLEVASAFVLGWHQSRIPLTWEKAKKRWKRFLKTEPFWSA